MRLCVIFGVYIFFNLSPSCDIGEPGMGSAPLSFPFLGSQPIAMLLVVLVYLILLFPLIVVSFSPSVFFFISLCVTSVPLSLSSCLGCIPPLIELTSLRFYAVASSLFLLPACFLFVFSILSRLCPLMATCLSVFFCLLSLLISYFRFDLVWFRLSCDHGWIRSGSVNVR